MYVYVLQDMSGLIHSMYEALEASVKPPHAGTTALKIKLVVTPSASPHKISHTGAAPGIIDIICGTNIGNRASEQWD